MKQIKANDRLIVALDLGSIEEARQLVDRLGDTVSFYKIGLSLQLASGSDFIAELIKKGKKIFLDYKYFDVGETIRKAVEQAAKLGVTFLTVHGNEEVVQAAVEGRGKSALQILSVTVLTSLDETDIRALGFPVSTRELVLHRAGNALKYGCDGVIASGQEAREIRALADGKSLLIVTPGIRPTNAKYDDHKRPTTPAQAIDAGADYLVVGRPITESADPLAKANEILTEMQGAFDKKGS